MPRMCRLKPWLFCLAVAAGAACFFWASKASDINSPEKKSLGRKKHHGAVQKLRTKNIFYNRVGKCGSRSLMQVVLKLSQKNNFRVKVSKETDVERPATFNQLQEIMTIGPLPPPTFYNRHIHYLDFKKWNFPAPIYINMVRDPIDRFASQYNYLKYGDETNMVKDRLKNDWEDINICAMKDVGVCNSSWMFYTGMYFCGMDNICTKPDSKERVTLAKKHIDEEYSVIGITEEFENTLRLFEVMLPEYFEGALSAWHDLGDFRQKTATKRQDVLTEESKEKLRKNNLADEYEVYYHAKRKFERLKKQYGIS